MIDHPLRLDPGQDLRRAIEEALHASGHDAGFVVAGIGSLGPARLRMAGADEPVLLTGDLEVLTLSGSISPRGAHLHMSVADVEGRVSGGHVALGCVVRTTAEVLIAWLPDWHFDRETDATTGHAELAIRPSTRGMR